MNALDLRKNQFIEHYFHGSCDPSTCPFCIEDDHEEEERIDKMTAEELRAELIQAGCDPDALVERVKEMIATYKT